MIVFWVFIVFGLGLSGLILVRNQIVYTHQMKALGIASGKARDLIDAKEYDKWRHVYDDLKKFGSYTRMIFDLRKWTYKQFYPGWE